MFEKTQMKATELMAKANCYASKAIDVCESNDTKLSATAATCFAMGRTLSAFADKASTSSSGGTSNIVGMGLGIVCYAFMVVGIFIVIYQTIQLVSSIKEENGDRQQKAIVGLVIGAVFIGIKPLAEKILSAAGVSVSISGSSDLGL